MKTTPQQFAQLLAHSTLSESERQAVLDQLEYLSPSQIEDFAKILWSDGKEKAKILRHVETQQERILTGVEVQMKQVKDEYEIQARKEAENEV